MREHPAIARHAKHPVLQAFTHVERAVVIVRLLHWIASRPTTDAIREHAPSSRMLLFEEHLATHALGDSTSYHAGPDPRGIVVGISSAGVVGALRSSGICPSCFHGLEIHESSLQWAPCSRCRPCRRPHCRGGHGAGGHRAFAPAGSFITSEVRSV